MTDLPCTPAPTRLQHVRPGSRLTVCEGTAWVTVDGRRADLVVEAGDSVLLDGAGPVFVHPLRSGGTLRLRVDPPPAPPRRRAADRPWTERLVAALRRRGVPLPHAA